VKKVQDEIVKVCDEIKELLLKKNKAYGNSALEPLRIFSQANADEQLKVRIDDKISRIKNQVGKDDEDAIADLIGYLILYKVLKNVENPVHQA
jgi:hypothetical protein